MKRLVWLVFIGAGTGASAGFAQTPAPSPAPYVFEVGIDLVSLTVVVRDHDGRFVRGLGPNDVQILEDGTPQEVAYFREASAAAEKRVPLTVILALDASGSMQKNLRFLQEAATHFVHKLEDVDRALVVQFNESIKGSAEFTGDTDRLDQFVEALQAWGGTSLHDAVHYALGRIKEEPGRKAVVVFSDGADTTSRLKEQEVIDYARAVEATVYCVGIRGEQGLIGRSPRGFLRKVAKETGGEFFFPERIGDLIRVFSAISDELHNHYLLGYTSKRPADGSWRAIEVRVKRPGIDVRVRKGYFAVKRPRR